ncbi:MAG: hypothetical protein KIT16_18470 [Rhodospirillaceae bacterium]|nr:hypothetical protein [Rhodospirillaceae bacterium]
MSTATAPVADADADARAPSMSFAVTSQGGAGLLPRSLDRLRAVARADDEIVVFAAGTTEYAEAECRRVGARLVAMPDASLFDMRARLPEVCRKSWLVLTEDHALLLPQTIVALRTLIARKPDLDIVPLLAVNVTSTSPWSWASFLQVTATLWSPLQEPPPICLPANVAIRRDVIGTDRALKDGQWEFELIPHTYQRGNAGWSNDIAIDHVKPLDGLAAFLLHFRNGWGSATINRRLLNMSRRTLRREARHVLTTRAAALRAAIAARLPELPRGTPRRMAILAVAHALGCLLGTLVPAKRALAKID